MIDPLHYPITVTGILLFAHFVLRRFLSRSSRLPLPPGPKGYPIIGNILEIGQQEQPWAVYSEIAKEYGMPKLPITTRITSYEFEYRPGDMFMLKSLGTNVLVLSSHKVATELLEQRSTVYSGRPYLPMLCGQWVSFVVYRPRPDCRFYCRMKYDEYFANAQYGPVWRRRRRAFHQHLTPTVVHRYHHISSGEAVQLLQDLALSPDRFRRHVQQ